MPIKEHNTTRGVSDPVNERLGSPQYSKLFNKLTFNSHKRPLEFSFNIENGDFISNNDSLNKTIIYPRDYHLFKRPVKKLYNMI